MGDRCTERARCGAFDIDVNPLVVTGRICELVDLFLRDRHVWAVAEVLPDKTFEFVCSVDDSWAHGDSMSGDVQF